jgi:hypothetical protein
VKLLSMTVHAGSGVRPGEAAVLQLSEQFYPVGQPGRASQVKAHASSSLAAKQGGPPGQCRAVLPVPCLPAE